MSTASVDEQQNDLSAGDFSGIVIGILVAMVVLVVLGFYMVGGRCGASGPSKNPAIKHMTNPSAFSSAFATTGSSDIVRTPSHDVVHYSSFVITTEATREEKFLTSSLKSHRQGRCKKLHSNKIHKSDVFDLVFRNSSYVSIRFCFVDINAKRVDCKYVVCCEILFNSNTLILRKAFLT